MEKVESFELDHRKVKAPYVRKCCVLEGEKGDKVSKFDLRFLQPNKESFGTAAMHGLEHLLAHELRTYLDGVIDLSPMGCRTGFYLSIWGDRNPEEIKNALESALKDVLKAESKDIVQKLKKRNIKVVMQMKYNVEIIEIYHYLEQRNMQKKF